MADSASRACRERAPPATCSILVLQQQPAWANFTGSEPTREKAVECRHLLDETGFHKVAGLDSMSQSCKLSKFLIAEVLWHTDGRTGEASMLV